MASCNDCGKTPKIDCKSYPDAHCINYSGANLNCIGITTNDRLDTILSKIDSKLCVSQSNNHITINAGPAIAITGAAEQDIASNPVYTINSKLSSSPNNSLIIESDGLWSPIPFKDGIVYGGTVTWTGVGYEYNIEASGYYINYVYYQSPAVTVTLAPADGTYDRIDTFILSSSSVAGVLTGTPSDNPAEPPLDTATELRIGAALVQTGTTQPLQDECLYQNNAEWVSFSSTVRINPDSTNSPCSGTKDIEGSLVQNNDYFTLTRGSSIRPYSYKNLSFSIKSKGSWGTNKLSFRWYSGSTPVGNSVIFANNSYGFKSNITTSCQSIVIPLSNFNLTSSDSVDNLRITVIGSNTFGWYLDSICLLANLIITPVNSDFLFQNGITRTDNVVELGGQLLHDTTLDTRYNRMLFNGATVYNYPYNFYQGQSFQNSVHITSFKHKGGNVITDADYNNAVRLGVNYTGGNYQSPDYPGYFDFDNIGYHIGTNHQVYGSYGVFPDDANSKVAGIFFHTLDEYNNDNAVTIYGSPSTTNTFSIQPGSYGMKNAKIAEFKTNKDVQLYGYPSTRDDGSDVKFLTTDTTGILKLKNVDKAIEVRFVVGNTGAPAAGITTLTLVDCSSNVLTNKKISIYLERYRLFQGDDFIYEASTGLITFATALLAGQRVVIEVMPSNLWTQCIYQTGASVGFPYDFPASF